MTHRVLVRQVLAGAVALSLVAVAPRIGAQSARVGCEEWDILGTAPAAQKQRVQACSPILREIPKIARLVERLNELAASGGANQATIDQFTRVLSDATKRLPADTARAVASTMADRFAESDQTSAQVLREIDRLRRDMEEWRDEIVTLESSAATADRARQAVRGAAADAITRLDFREATDILGRLEKKIDDTLTVLTATTLMDRAVNARDGSVQGQGDAISFLFSRGHEFSSVNWSGINLSGVNLFRDGAALNLSTATLHLANFARADLRAANLSETGLRFSMLDEAKLDRAVLDKSYAPFLSAVGASFRGARAKGANFFAGDFRNADFSNADLSGASFAFADLRDAHFDGANLTGTYFSGAILDKATFAGATVRETAVLGAVSDAFTFDKTQVAGLCRHESGPRMQWDVLINERYPGGRSDSGYEFEQVVHSQGFFDTFGDRSLPACSSPFDAANDFDVRFAGRGRMLLDRVYVSKAGRRAAVRERVAKHFALVQGMALASRLLRGTGDQQRSWAAEMAVNTAKTRAIGPPHINSDQLLLLALRHKALTVDDVDWKKMAEARHSFESRNRRFVADFEQISMFGRLFPASATRLDLPADYPAAYRRWTEGRVSQVPNQLVFMTAFTLNGAQAQADAEQFPVLATGLMRTTAEGLTVSNRGRPFGTNVAALAAKVGANDDRVLDAPANLDAAGVGRTLFVFPMNRRAYRIAPPRALFQVGSARQPDIHMEWEVTSVEAFSQGTGPKLLLIFVKPLEARAIVDGQVAWRGPVTTNGNVEK